MITIIDYGMGNLRSVQKACEHLGYDAIISSDPIDISKAEILILPGVGEFGSAMGELSDKKLIDPIKEYVASGRKFIGICLGMQLVFDSSQESPETKGFGFLKGTCKKFIPGKKMPVPHMGWNTIKYKDSDDRICSLFNGIPQNSYFYFVHSFYVEPEDSAVIAGKTEYGIEYASIILKDNIIAAQFHPEKSQAKGLDLLKNIIEL